MKAEKVRKLFGVDAITYQPVSSCMDKFILIFALSLQYVDLGLDVFTMVSSSRVCHRRRWHCLCHLSLTVSLFL